MRENQKKAVGAYYQRNKELLYLKKLDRLNKIKDDPDAYDKLKMKRHEYYQSRKLKDPEYLKKQCMQKKEKSMNMAPYELSFQL